MILPKLKQATREHHLALESQMPILDPLLSLETYQDLLRKFHGYYAPLEMQLLGLMWWDEIDFSYTERFKTPRLGARSHDAWRHPRDHCRITLL